MADTKSKSGSPPPPSFYSAAAGMKPGGSAGGPSSPSSSPDQSSGEKVKNIEVLLEVFNKMDKLEQDADSKAMIASMVDIAKKYLDKLKGNGGKPSTSPATGEAGSGGGPGAGGDMTGAGNTAGAGAGAMTGVGAPGMA